MSLNGLLRRMETPVVTQFNSLSVDVVSRTGCPYTGDTVDS